MEKMGLKHSDVVVTKALSVNATVTVPEDATLDIGTLLSSNDGGVTFTTQTTPAYAAGSYDTAEEVYHLGHIWESLADANTAVPGSDPVKWEDKGAWNANGVLCDYIETTSTANVLVSGVVVEHNLSGFEEALRATLFGNKIILK
ncbi:MAG: hypothetical protein PHG81_05855 [Aliarcobacter sp.]|nr:hypothetical protein [Aliarcobacter sp.]